MGLLGSSRGVRLSEPLARLQAIARYVVAAVWTFPALALVFAGGRRALLGVAGGLIVVAFLRWPAVLRWPLTAFCLVCALGFTAFSHWYFHALINYSFIAWMCVGTIGHWLLLFGEMTLVRLVAGAALFVAPHFGFPLERLESPISASACEERVTALSRRVERSLESLQFAIPGVNLPALSRGSLVLRKHPTLVVTPSLKQFKSHLPDDASEAGVELHARVARMAQAANGASGPSVIYLAADASEPVSEIALLVAHLSDVQLLLIGKSGHQPPGPPPASSQDLADEFERAAAVSSSETARVVSRRLSRLAAPCAPLAKSVLQIQEVKPAERTQFWAKSLDQGLRECRCSWVDIDAIEYLTLRINDSPTPRYFSIEVPRDGTGHFIVPSDPGVTVEQWVQRLPEK